MDDELIAITRDAGIDAVVERRLCQQREGVGVPLFQRRRVDGSAVAGNDLRAGIERLTGGAGVETDAPGEPGGAGAEAGVPAIAGIELAYLDSSVKRLTLCARRAN